MKNKLRFIIIILALVLGVILAFPLMGCQDPQDNPTYPPNQPTPPTQLLAPTGLNANRNIFTWQAVAGAISYEIRITEFDSPRPAGNNTRFVLPIGLMPGQTYKLFVRAVGDGVLYTTSNWSQYFEYTASELTSLSLLDASGFIISGTTAHTAVSNATQVFNFANIFTICPTATFTISSDILGEQTLATSMPLEIGDNTAYLWISVGSQRAMYTLTIRRRSMLVVEFYTQGGTQVAPISVEEGSRIQAPTIPIQRPPFTFGSWDFNFNNPIMQDTVISSLWAVNYLNTNGVNATRHVANIFLLDSNSPDILQSVGEYSFFIVNSNTSFNTLTISGTVKILLANNAILSVDNLVVPYLDALYIYAQSAGVSAGQLIVTNTIGGINGANGANATTWSRNGGHGVEGTTSGAITINGGYISASHIGGGNGGNAGWASSPLQEGMWGVAGGIGGNSGRGGDSGVITINAGVVNADSIGGGNGGIASSGASGRVGHNDHQRHGGAGGNGGTGGRGGDSSYIFIRGGTINAYHIGGGAGGLGGHGGMGGQAAMGYMSHNTNISGIGGNGGNGGRGGEADYINISGGTISAVSIGGGMGATGGNGANGARAGMPMTNWRGGNGGTGGLGGHGGRGGHSENIAIVGGSITATQNIGGGFGGTGGAGGNGGDGWNGWNNGPGSDGGNAARGGNGGNGGNIEQINISNSVQITTPILGYGGIGGNYGLGGTGGTRGVPGVNGSIYGTVGTNGINGTQGANGTSPQD